MIRLWHGQPLECTEIEQLDDPADIDLSANAQVARRIFSLISRRGKLITSETRDLTVWNIVDVFNHYIDGANDLPLGKAYASKVTRAGIELEMAAGFIDEHIDRQQLERPVTGILYAATATAMPNDPRLHLSADILMDYSSPFICDVEPIGDPTNDAYQSVLRAARLLRLNHIVDFAVPEDAVSLDFAEQVGTPQLTAFYRLLATGEPLPINT